MNRVLVRSTENGSFLSLASLCIGYSGQGGVCKSRFLCTVVVVFASTSNAKVKEAVLGCFSCFLLHHTNSFYCYNGTKPWKS